MAAESSVRHLAFHFAITFIGLAFGFIHRWHVSTLFENDRHFSHLSEIEREMSFRTEMGMYYSYYKRIVESKDFDEGLEKLSHDNMSEFGNVFNAGRKYSLLPEILAGYLYHCAKNLGLISTEQCWQIEREGGMPPVTSCVGLGVPIYFYLELVWLSTVFTAAMLFYYSVYLSNTVTCGIITILFFFYNHNECTRVQWTPPLRESFAYPMLLFEMYKVTMILRESTDAKGRSIPRGSFVDLCFSIVLSLGTWQFSQFVFTTQIVALLIMKWLRIISNDLYKNICSAHGGSIVLSLTFVNSAALTSSLYVHLLLASTTVSTIMNRLSRLTGARLGLALEIVLIVILTKYLKSSMLMSEDYTHVTNLLKAKLTDYKDFHTMLYTCAAEFDFLQYRNYEAIVSTLLLPTAILAGILAIYYWYRNYKNDRYPKCIEPHMFYNGLQTGAFIIMAVFIMRLKLFMNPHLCIIAGTVCAQKYLVKVGLKSEMSRSAFIVLLVASMSYHGLERLQKECEIMGEYNNIEQEELFEWIKNNTPEHAVFAGTMSLMANLMLSTKRSIVNNPYYESKDMRDRTMKVYEIFSRKEASSVYFTLRNMHVGYVVLEEPLCLGYANVKSGCQMIDLWDMMDNGTAKANGKTPLCPLLFQGNAYPFKRAFVNSYYVVLQLDYSHYVEVKPKNSVPLHYQS